MASSAIQLKDQGNRHFQAGEYVVAEGLYSKAIIQDPSNPALYTNRALTRLKLELWESVIDDCQRCLELKPENMKAFYYLSQAQLAMKDYDAALENGLKAHEICARTSDKSLSAVTNLILNCKKERWEALERRRIRQGTELENEMLGLLEREREKALSEAVDDFERRDIAAEWDEKITELKRTFEAARAADSKRRAVPDWAIDDITFGIMVDPVITKTGKSYERASIMEHLRRHQTDPLTRDPLLPSDLRPNLALKQACEEFLDENGWAVDW
ncbi:hypothetical protein jhhlp_003927 [Lomentospora prolificans]|uniref:E3 ubiquitin-protein ligase CHIP n=1 Tax=Lomentospora prolificans TaxID=41688 RepID=A0A2N3NA49_9PEZI|nr:hypothetical protein jhhlp_003927 [Lomentospora prolificans]